MSTWRPMTPDERATIKALYALPALGDPHDGEIHALADLSRRRVGLNDGWAACLVGLAAKYLGTDGRDECPRV